MPSTAAAVERGRPITITQNGEAKIVVMDVENYDRWRASLALLKVLPFPLYGT